MLVSLVIAAVTRAVLVGGAVWLAMLLWPGIDVTPRHPLAILWFGLMGSAMLAFMGVMTSIWAEKFDHAAAITNFVVAPLALLSGTFYSVDAMAPAFRALSHANPFFYVISGFRYGFIGPERFAAAVRGSPAAGDQCRARPSPAMRCCARAGSCGPDRSAAGRVAASQARYQCMVRRR